MANAVLEQEERYKSHLPQSTAPNLTLSVSPPSPAAATLASMVATSTKKGSLPSRKSVDFAILPPPKRSRPTAPWTAKQVIDAIATSITPEERLEAVQKARDSFRHDVQSMHDDEMAAGADAALTKHLAYLLYMQREWGNSSTQPQDALMNEMAVTIEALETLYRASSHVVGASFKRMGEELMHLVISIINGEVSRRQASMTDESRPMSPLEDALIQDGDTILRRATKILGHFARVGEATKPIAHHSGLLASLVSLVSLRPYENTPWEARLSALWTIANLACNADNMRMIADTPGLVQAIVEVACRPLDPNDPIESTMEILRARSISSRAILNLSWFHENKISLAENASLIDLLAELMVRRPDDFQRSRTIQEILNTTRRHALGALRNLAAAPRRTKITLCAYKNGHLLDVLTDAALNDPDPIVKDRSFATIHNLSIHDTADAIAGRPALIMALKDVLVADDDAMPNKGEHTDGTPKQHASATLLVLERTITPTMGSYQNLRGLLEAIKTNSKDHNEEVTDSAEV